MIDDNEVLVEAIDRYGTEAQLLMVLEEMSELQKEICKFFRGKRDREALADEVADVEIMLEQVKIIFDLHEAVWAHTDRKIGRLRERLAKPRPTIQVDAPLFDVESVYENCTVQVLRNTLSGEQSIGWWPNGKDPNGGEEVDDDDI